MSDLNKTFSENLQYYMNEKKITRYKLCMDLNLRYTTFCGWYRGEIVPKIDNVEMLANYLGLRISDLLENRLTKLEENTSFLELYKSLSSQSKLEVMHYMQFLNSRQK